MIYTLENEFLTVKINSLGAEVFSIVDRFDNHEYIWNGNLKYWGRHAPVLFPIIGKLKDNRYKFQQKEYKMNQHGFAKDMEFTKEYYSKDKLELCLNYDESTIVQYPFKFQLQVSYELKQRMLIEKYNVKNADEKCLWFSIGGHPGFCCSVKPEGCKNIKLLFTEKETVSYLENESGYLTGRKIRFMKDQDCIDVDKINFDENKKVYTLEGLKSKSLVIDDKGSGKKVHIDFDGFKYIGIWSPSNDAPFICIEPWYGITSTYGLEKDLDAKQGIIKLDPEKCFSCKFDVVYE